MGIGQSRQRDVETRRRLARIRSSLARWGPFRVEQVHCTSGHDPRDDFNEPLALDLDHVSSGEKVSVTSLHDGESAEAVEAHKVRQLDFPWGGMASATPLGVPVSSHVPAPMGSPCTCDTTCSMAVIVNTRSVVEASCLSSPLTVVRSVTQRMPSAMGSCGTHIWDVVGRNPDLGVDCSARACPTTRADAGRPRAGQGVRNRIGQAEART